MFGRAAVLAENPFDAGVAAVLENLGHPHRQRLQPRLRQSLDNRFDLVVPAQVFEALLQQDQGAGGTRGGPEDSQEKHSAASPVCSRCRRRGFLLDDPQQPGKLLETAGVHNP